MTAQGMGPLAFPEGRDIEGDTSIGRSEGHLCWRGGIVGWVWAIREGLTENKNPGGAGGGER